MGHLANRERRNKEACKEQEGKAAAHVAESTFPVCGLAMWAGAVCFARRFLHRRRPTNT